MERGFIIYPTYAVDEDGPVVQLYGRLENGETFRIDSRADPHFFIRAADAERAAEIAGIATEETELRTLSGEPVVRVTVHLPKDVPPLRKRLEDGGIPCYEADVRFAYRFLIDHGIKGAVSIDGPWEKGAHVDRVYTDPAVASGTWDGTLRVLSIDIETDRKASALWSVCLATGNRTEKLIVGREVEGARCFPDEKALLSALADLVCEIDPDIITGWNVVDFDLKVLASLYRKHRLPWTWGRSDRECALRIESEFLRDSSADVPGRVVLDGIMLLRTSFIRLDTYTLEAAAQEFLGDGKLFTGEHRFAQIAEAYENDPALLLAYNLKDAQLVLDILAKTKVLALTVERSLLTGMQLDRVKASIASLDMVYLPRLRARGFVAPSVGYTLKEEPVTGGFVMESKPGIYDYVIVCDFKSLYPSIMRTLNIDPVAYRPGVKRKKSDEEYVVAENGAVFAHERGILPQILQELWEERERARTRKDELARYAIKILMNSFYGVLASPNCRFFSLEMANAITQTGQHIIKRSVELIREAGYDVIYGDTDSLFVDVQVSSQEDAVRIGREIERMVNAFFPEYVRERYCAESFLELEYEKTFVRFLMPKTRSGEGSKKRYAGIVVKDGKEEIDFTGLEFVRRDWTELAKEFQFRLLDLVFHRKDPQEFIRSFVAEVRAGKHDGLLVYRKSLRKRVEAYTKTTPPHVKAARLLESITSNVIEYVMTVHGPEPVGNVKHSIDYDHYVDKQLRPIADSILTFYGTSFSDVLKGTKQKGLFEF